MYILVLGLPISKMYLLLLYVCHAISTYLCRRHPTYLALYAGSSILLLVGNEFTYVHFYLRLYWIDLHHTNFTAACFCAILVITLLIAQYSHSSCGFLLLSLLVSVIPTKPRLHDTSLTILLESSDRFLSSYLHWQSRTFLGVLIILQFSTKFCHIFLGHSKTSKSATSYYIRFPQIFSWLSIPTAWLPLLFRQTNFAHQRVWLIIQECLDEHRSLRTSDRYCHPLYSCISLLLVLEVTRILVDCWIQWFLLAKV